MHKIAITKVAAPLAALIVIFLQNIFGIEIGIEEVETVINVFATIILGIAIFINPKKE